MSRRSLAPAFLALLLLVPVCLEPRSAWCDLYMQFLVDRSGSIWAPVNGRPKTVLITEALEQASRDLPPDVAMGLRVYPPPGSGGDPEDPGLRIPLGTGNRDLFPVELEGLNPRGKAPLLEHLGKALDDFPDNADSKLLIVITDGADNDGRSFCEQKLMSDPPEALHFHILSLNMQDEEERRELDCLGRLFAGESSHLGSGGELRQKVLAVSREAHRRETARQARILEEQRRQALLNSKTRLQVSFQNTLDPFFADSLEVSELQLDDRTLSLDPPATLVSGQRTVIFEGPVPEGPHQLHLQYRMRRGDEHLLSRPGSMEVVVEEGKTSFVLALPKSALFHWGCTLHPVEP